MSTIITNNAVDELNKWIGKWQSQEIFILTDSHTYQQCLPTLQQIDKIKNANVLSIHPGDTHKNINTAIEIWQFLVRNMANRHSLMINVGGGMVTDIGGFTAGTFKRGMSYINIATSLLGAVDAATGGKTGINFDGYKNEVGIFAPSLATIIDVNFFRTLDSENIKSGYAEMLKHALIYNEEHWEKLTQFDIDNIDYVRLQSMLKENISIKENIVAEDPKEMGIRKALNFGHTIGHAIESHLLNTKRPVLHGYAIAWGMICELYISTKTQHFPNEKFEKIKTYLIDMYGKPRLNKNEFETLMELMKHDKKNKSGEINLTLLNDIGQIIINQTPEKELIKESLSNL